MRRATIGWAAFVLVAAACSSAQEGGNDAAGDAGEAAATGESAETVAADATRNEIVAASPKPGDRAAEAAAPPGRMVDCLIVTNGDDYRGPCRFFAERGGSFSLSLDDESTLVDEITMVSVTVLDPGHADVRGLTTSGINSRWGEADRDAEDRACWNGADFTICAY